MSPFTYEYFHSHDSGSWNWILSHWNKSMVWCELHYIQCVSNGDTAVLRQAIYDILVSCDRVLVLHFNAVSIVCKVIYRQRNHNNRYPLRCRTSMQSYLESWYIMSYFHSCCHDNIELWQLRVANTTMNPAHDNYQTYVIHVRLGPHILNM